MARLHNQNHRVEVIPVELCVGALLEVLDGEVIYQVGQLEDAHFSGVCSQREIMYIVPASVYSSSRSISSSGR